MPIFEYRCTSCENNFEVLQRTSGEKKPVACPKCGTFETKKRLSSFSSSGSKSDIPQDTSS
ncbi:zinc ribbon domain-containing protein [Candidatus Poribacteria bacterium]|nr:MAG: zinc ribbon domain-containing protein [Candidatus Poribacteria bacterium]